MLLQSGNNNLQSIITTFNDNNIYKEIKLELQKSFDRKKENMLLKIYLLKNLVTTLFYILIYYYNIYYNNIYSNILFSLFYYYNIY